VVKELKSFDEIFFTANQTRPVHPMPCSDALLVSAHGTVAILWQRCLISTSNLEAAARPLLGVGVAAPPVLEFPGGRR